MTNGLFSSVDAGLFPESVVARVRGSLVEDLFCFFGNFDHKVTLSSVVPFDSQ
jgi:hypothetical protein